MTLVSTGDERVAEYIGIVERDELEDTIRTTSNERSGLSQRLYDFVRG